MNNKIYFLSKAQFKQAQLLPTYKIHNKLVLINKNLWLLNLDDQPIALEAKRQVFWINLSSSLVLLSKVPYLIHKLRIKAIFQPYSSFVMIFHWLRNLFEISFQALKPHKNSKNYSFHIMLILERENVY